MKLKFSLASVLLAMTALTTGHSIASAHSERGYYRAPTLHGDQLIFTAEGDLWTQDISQHNASRLTSLPAEEIDASISKDGKWVAFSADYDGAQEVYVMPVKGGVAKRVSFENSRVRVQGWTEAGDVLYSTDNAHGPANYWVLRMVNPDTLMTTDLPLADAIEGVIDAKANYVYFVRFGLQTTGDNARVYRGGATGELWRYKIGSNEEAIPLTKKHRGSVRNPMLWNDRIYYISDEDGTDNLWSMKINGGDVWQHTYYKSLPMRAASLDNGRVVFQQGADIKLLDLQSNKDRKLNIHLVSDSPMQREHWVKKPLNYLTSTNLAVNGDKVVLTARGHVAVVSGDGSRLVNINSPKTSRLRNAILSQNGKWVFAIADISGEQEIWRFAADGSKHSKQLTRDGNSMRMSLRLSPDGRYLAHDDYDGNVWLLDLKSGKNNKIIKNGEGLGPYADIVWSGDSRFIALTKAEIGKSRSQIVLYELESKKSQALTTDKYESFSPSFSRDGQWLYFLSNRMFRATPSSPWGDRNMGPVFDKRTQVFAISLNPKAHFPFQAPNELIDLAKASKTDKEQKWKIDWQGINQRLWQVPVASGNYSRLSVADNKLYLLDKSAKQSELKYIKFDNRSPKVASFGRDIKSYELSVDASKLFVRKGRSLYIVDAKTAMPKDVSKAKVNIQNWQLAINPRQEWQQMFDDAWLMHRDSFFDKNMRGIDWRKAKKKYQPLVDRVTDRYELNDVFKQMMGELNALHSQVRGGDVDRDPARPQAASLGAWLEQTQNGVKIAHIFDSDPELPAMASPLRKMGVDAKQGDIIVSINEDAVNTVADVNQLLRNQAKQQVLLTLKRNGKLIKTIVNPVTIGVNAKLRYQDWVETNMDKVSNASNGKIGYLHLYAMGANDIANFAREFYANYNKQGLIIDVRRNRGGNIDSWIIEKLLRKAWAFWKPTHGSPSTNMQQTFRGHLVVLTDQLTYSDGETFAAGIKTLGLAPLIGKQTAGAGVWLSGRNRLVDKGMARVAEYPQYSMDGRWIIEGIGVKPDIEVSNLPLATFEGKDAQLNRAIEYLQQKLQQAPVSELNAQPMSRIGHAQKVK
ncbi:MAG: S41 family peptidase [Parashewanella sp.]